MINPLFKYHSLKPSAINKTELVAEAFSQLLTTLEEVCPPITREFSIVKTKLEEACFYAKKSIANAPENQA